MRNRHTNINYTKRPRDISANAKGDKMKKILFGECEACESEIIIEIQEDGPVIIPVCKECEKMTYENGVSEGFNNACNRFAK